MENQHLGLTSDPDNLQRKNNNKNSLKISTQCTIMKIVMCSGDTEIPISMQLTSLCKTYKAKTDGIIGSNLVIHHSSRIF